MVPWLINRTWVSSFFLMLAPGSPPTPMLAGGILEGSIIMADCCSYSCDLPKGNVSKFILMEAYFCSRSELCKWVPLFPSFPNIQGLRVIEVHQHSNYPNSILNLSLVIYSIKMSRTNGMGIFV